MRSARIRFCAPSSGARALGQALGFAPADLPKLLAAIAADSEEGREEAAVAAKAQKQALVARVGLAACAVAFFSLVYVFIMYTDVVCCALLGAILSCVRAGLHGRVCCRADRVLLSGSVFDNQRPREKLEDPLLFPA